MYIYYVSHPSKIKATWINNKCASFLSLCTEWISDLFSGPSLRRLLLLRTSSLHQVSLHPVQESYVWWSFLALIYIHAHRRCCMCRPLRAFWRRAGRLSAWVCVCVCVYDHDIHPCVYISCNTVSVCILQLPGTPHQLSPRLDPLCCLLPPLLAMDRDSQHIWPPPLAQR